MLTTLQKSQDCLQISARVNLNYEMLVAHKCVLLLSYSAYLNKCHRKIFQVQRNGLQFCDFVLKLCCILKKNQSYDFEYFVNVQQWFAFIILIYNEKN